MTVLGSVFAAALLLLYLSSRPAAAKKGPKVTDIVSLLIPWEF